LLESSNFSSWVYSRYFLEHRDGLENVVVCGTAMIPYAVRRTERMVNIYSDVLNLPFGGVPGEEIDRAMNVLLQLYDSARPAETVLDSTLIHATSINNTVPCILNAGAIENRISEQFIMHIEGMSDPVFNVVEAPDQDIALGKNSGISPPHFPQAAGDKPEEFDGKSIYPLSVDWLDETWGPNSPMIDTRYMHEAVGLGATFLSSLDDYFRT